MTAMTAISASQPTPASEIDEKLTRLLKLIPELEIYGNRIKSLEEEQKYIQESLQSSQVEVKEVKDLQEKFSKQQESIEASIQHVECELAELQHTATPPH